VKKITFIVIAIFITLIAGLTFFALRTEKKTVVGKAATNYEECVEAQGVISESYPAVCTTGDGKKFTQDIGNELEKHDLIRIENPRPGQTISSPLNIRGEARGSWFFEANFPVKLLDSQGNTIAESFVESEGEWMTQEFVPFTGTLEFEKRGTGGTLILEKANPSDLPHNADRLEIPVSF
jgi:hypothetical protein